MKRRYKIALTVLILVVFAVVSIGLFIDPLLDVAGRFLVIIDKPKKSDIVFVPSGNPRTRFVKAIDLTKAGLADSIVLVIEKKSEEDREFESRYGKAFSSEALIRHIIEIEGISKSQVIIPDKRSRSTSDDFAILKEIMKREKFRSAIVTTSWYHMRRCQLVAKRFLGDDTIIYFIPANLPDKDHFISRTKRIQGIFNAYVRLCYYYATTF